MEIRAEVLSAVSIELSWRPSAGATGYRVLWDAGAGNETRWSRALVDEPIFLDDELQPGAYRFWVVAIGPGGESEPASIEVTIPFRI